MWFSCNDTLQVCSASSEKGWTWTSCESFTENLSKEGDIIWFSSLQQGFYVRSPTKACRTGNGGRSDLKILTHRTINPISEKMTVKMLVLCRIIYFIPVAFIYGWMEQFIGVELKVDNLYIQPHPEHLGHRGPTSLRRGIGSTMAQRSGWCRPWFTQYIYMGPSQNVVLL